MPEQIPLTPRQLYKRAYYEANKEKAQAYREANKTKIAEQQRAWREANPDYLRSYYEANKTVILKRDYSEAQIRRKAETARAWCESNPERKRDLRVRRQKNTVGTLTPGIILKLLESQKWACVACSKNLRLGYHVDHIVPVSKGGKNIDDNIQLLCPTCNLSKGNKDFAEFLKGRGLDPSGFSSISNPSESPALEEA